MDRQRATQITLSALLAWVFVWQVFSWRFNLGLLWAGRALLAERAAAPRAASYLDQVESSVARRARGLMWARMGNESAAIDQWKQGDTNLVHDFAWFAEVARRADRSAEAVIWYERVATLGGDGISVADNHFYAGWMYTRLDAWEEAIAAFEKGVDSADFQLVQPSDPYYQLGLIHHIYTTPPAVETAYNHYNQALSLDQFSQPSQKAASYYGRGEMFRLQGAQMAALADYERATDLDSTYGWAYMQRAMVGYELTGDFPTALATLQYAETVWDAESSQKWLLTSYGQLYAKAGQPTVAQTYYDRAQALDP